MSNENDELPVVGHLHPIVGFLTPRQGKTAESGAMMDLVLLSDAQRIRDERDRLREALEKAKRLCDEALPKFNWGASALDANAIQLLNEVPRAISAALAGEKT